MMLYGPLRKAFIVRTCQIEISQLIVELIFVFIALLSSASKSPFVSFLAGTRRGLGDPLDGRE